MYKIVIDTGEEILGSMVLQEFTSGENSKTKLFANYGEAQYFAENMNYKNYKIVKAEPRDAV